MNSNGLLRKHWVQVTLHFLLDAAAFLICCIAAAHVVIEYDDLTAEAAIAAHWPSFVIAGAAFAASIYIAGLYTSHSINRSGTRRFFMLGCCIVFAVLLYLGVSYAFTARSLGRIFLGTAAGFIGFVAALHHGYLLYALKTARERVAYLVTCPFDEGEMAVFSEIGLQDFEFAGTITAMGYSPSGPGAAKVLGKSTELERLVREHRLDRILVTNKALAHTALCRQFCQLRYSGVTVMPLITLCEEVDQHVPIELITPEWLLNASGEPQLLYIKKVKRLFDIVVSSMGLILGAPVLLLAMLAVKVTSRGPVFYHQRRSAKFGADFHMVKLRTMCVDAEKNGVQWAQGSGANGSRDPRVTIIGGVLRKYRIDELPQLWNVLKGEMSFVGPRPERPELITEIAKQVPYYEERMLVQPGITGWAQVNYPYGASVMDARRKLEYDLYYLKHMSIFLDVFILLDTVRTVLFGGAKSRVRRVEASVLERLGKIQSEIREPANDMVGVS